MKMTLQPVLRVCILFCFPIALLAQPATNADIDRSLADRRKLARQSILNNYPVRNIGPTVQGARLVDIEVNEKNTSEYYVAFASGGIFKTSNNGITFEPVFDNQDLMGIGDFALSQSDTDILYVGTGEKNSSRSSYAGSGVYKTEDGGKHWTHLGLSGTQHVSRILIHPQNNNIAWVAAIGALYSSNPDRGVFKTIDGGKTWKKTLFINDSTGVIDLVINPSNANHLIAAAWERSRKAWNFKGSGSGSAIYTSTDGGETWSKSMNGINEGGHLGRIGLKFSPSKPQVVYAFADNQEEVADKKERKTKVDPNKLQVSEIKDLSADAFQKLDDKKLEDFLRDNNYPKKYTAETVKRDIKENKFTPRHLADYLGNDALTNLMKTKIKGAEVYRSGDGGKNWKLVNGYDLDGIYYTYGYYFGEINVAPDDPEKVYILGVPLLKSIDGGAKWHRLDTLKGVRNVHIDHHALWINPKDSKHLRLGNDGGLYESYDEGATWRHINNMPVGQFYTVNVDMETPYNVYGGLQDNGILKGSSKSIPNETKHWDWIFWGDGMFVSPDPRNHKMIYAGYQFGHYYRVELDKNKNTKITPQHDIGAQPYRWNWRAPFFISKHNPEVLYLAANKVFRSMNKGETWEIISDDLTKNQKHGNVPFGTIASICESPLKFGVLYAGTDDGNLWLSKDGGGNWVSINEGLPKQKWVSSIQASSHHEGTVFVSLNGYREDDFSTYLFMSQDFGKTWKSISGNLPDACANVVIQDPVNAELLYCGLDNGTYVSLDQGKNWHLLPGMLNVAAYDMIVHPRDHELVVATHGRSVFVADVKPLQGVKSGEKKSIYVFSPEPVRFDEKWGEQEYAWSKASKPTVELVYYLEKKSSPAEVKIYDEKDKLVREFNVTKTNGFHRLVWDMKILSATDSKSKEQANELTFAGKGKYKVVMKNGADSSEAFVEIK